MKSTRNELDRIRRAVMSRLDGDTRNELAALVDVVSELELRITQVEEKAEYAYEKTGGYAI